MERRRTGPSSPILIARDARTSLRACYTGVDGSQQACSEEDVMKIQLTSIVVDDQEKASRFYTQVLGFVLKRDLPAGGARWLTVVSPEGPDDVELVLEPNGNPAAQVYQRALYEQGIPWTAFAVDDILAEYARLEGLGVRFVSPPTKMGPAQIAVFDDTCGNLVQIYQAFSE
jgi:catechol 2,3-dioxygenase-like lactoylglutathione lyase family enzyme